GNGNSASSPVGTCPPVQVTFWITALSPVPVCCSARCQPGLGTNEPIEKPLGTVSAILVVEAPDFSVGTARLYSCNSFASETAGLTRACADDAACKDRVKIATSAERRTSFFMRPPSACRGRL